MRAYLPISMTDLKSLTGHSQMLIGKIRAGLREQNDVAQIKEMITKLTALNLIDVHADDFDIRDDQLRLIATEQKTSSDHAQSVRMAIREFFYQLYHDYLVSCINTSESHSKAKNIANSLRLVAEWACIKIGYSLMYAADGKHGTEAEDVFRSMLDKSVAATFFCAEIHASGLILSEQSGARQYDYDEALELLSRNLKPDVLVRNAVYYVRSAIRYAEIVLAMGGGNQERTDFITNILLAVKTSVCEKKIKISDSDFRKLLSCMTNVLLSQIESAAVTVVDLRIASGLTDVPTGRLALSDVSVSASGLTHSISKITMD